MEYTRDKCFGSRQNRTGTSSFQSSDSLTSGPRTADGVQIWQEFKSSSNDVKQSSAYARNYNVAPLENLGPNIRNMCPGSALPAKSDASAFRTTFRFPYDSDFRRFERPDDFSGTGRSAVTEYAMLDTKPFVEQPLRFPSNSDSYALSSPNLTLSSSLQIPSATSFDLRNVNSSSSSASAMINQMPAQNPMINASFRQPSQHFPFVQPQGYVNRIEDGDPQFVNRAISENYMNNVQNRPDNVFSHTPVETMPHISSNFGADSETSWRILHQLPCRSMSANSSGEVGDPIEQFTRRSVHSVGNNEGENISEVQLFVNHWLANRNKHLPTKESANHKEMKLWEVKDCLRTCLVLLYELGTMRKNLKESCEKLSEDEWEKIVKEVELKKMCVQSELDKMRMNADLERLKIMMKYRKKKRNRQKRKKEEIQKNRLTNEKRRMKLHQQIDMWRDEIQEKLEQVKRKESVKKEADLVLGAVTRRKTEANKFLTILSSLVKLRQIRSQAAERKGLHRSTARDDAFEQVTEGLQKLWDERLKNYKAEEQALRVMLEEEQEERSKNEKKNKKKKLLQVWEQFLFGKEPTADNDMFPYFQLYTEANRNVEAFLQTRRSWDKFMVSNDAIMASSIPIGWVVPAPPSSENWKKMLTSTGDEV